MPKVTTLVCDGCHVIKDVDDTVTEYENGTILCGTCKEARSRREGGRPYFLQVEAYSHSREEITYGGPYPQLSEVHYACEWIDATCITFFGDQMTPEEALEAIDTIKGISVEDFRPSWGAHADINWEVKVYWHDVPIDVAEDAVDEFLKPALGLINEDGEAIDPPWVVPQTQQDDEL